MVVILLTAVASWSADAPDWHMTADHVHSLFCKSAFVHGYMHGYEQGFHVADLDLQMGRSARRPEKLPEFRETAGYKRQFGGRHIFEDGYREGFRVGYGDGMGERPFRAMAQVRAAAAGLAEEKNIQPSKIFDEGVTSGYRAGSVQGLHDGRSSTGFRTAAASCPGDSPHDPRRADEYCAGYSRGYRLGYADGYVNQSPQTLAATGK